jgi:hypothetical protein
MTVTYTIDKPARAERATAAGLVEFEFKPGDVTPDSPEETAALEALVAARLAKRSAKASKPTPTKTTTKVEE